VKVAQESAHAILIARAKMRDGFSFAFIASCKGERKERKRKAKLLRNFHRSIMMKIISRFIYFLLNLLLQLLYNIPVSRMIESFNNSYALYSQTRLHYLFSCDRVVIIYLRLFYCGFFTRTVHTSSDNQMEILFSQLSLI